MSELRTVHIYGEKYTLRSDEDPDYIQEVATFVDTKMREIAGSGKVISTDKIAILAALNIADEFFKSRRSHQESDEAAGRRIEKILVQLRGAVGD